MFIWRTYLVFHKIQSINWFNRQQYPDIWCKLLWTILRSMSDTCSTIIGIWFCVEHVQSGCKELVCSSQLETLAVAPSSPRVSLSEEQFILPFVVLCISYIFTFTLHEKHTGIYCGIDQIKTIEATLYSIVYVISVKEYYLFSSTPCCAL